MNARNTSPKMHLAAILFSAAAFGASSPALALSPENSGYDAANADTGGDPFPDGQ